MHLILHIFKKDVRRLGWGIAIALLIQTVGAWLDAGGSSDSTQLSLLLLAAWAILLALAVYEDPLVSDRQFWITRPARWRVLLGSKLLFAFALVHVPSFLADVILLAARGFRPWEWLASLLIKQLTIAAVLTLPMIALAAVLPGFAHLALAVIAIVAYVIGRQLVGEPLRGKRLIVLPAVLTVVGFIDLRGAKHIDTADIVWLTVGAIGSLLIGLAFGTATTAFAVIKRALAALGCPKVNLQVRADNADALGFYAAIGYSTDAVVSLGKRLIADE